jgi:gliding motility-associated-like protein
MVIGQSEICDNGIDDDNDGLIDLNDGDCPCEIIEPVSLIPNPSFEEMNCCPNNRSQLNCASQWIQASEPTTDFIHTCNWLGWDDFPPPFPFPDGQGIMGFRDGRVRGNNQPEPYWKEYAGACLISPLKADSVYRFKFDVGFVDSRKSPPIDISFFGTPSCQNLPFGVGNEAFGCPSNSPNWKKLAEVNVSGGTGNNWVNASLEITPEEDIYAIAIGPDCAPVSSPISIYYFFDNLLLANFESFNLEVTETDHPCNSDFTLSVPLNQEFEYQWYLDGVALAGEVNAGLSQNYGEGNYQVRILDGLSCRVSASYDYQIPEFQVPASVAICPGEFYEFGDLDLTEPGIYLDTFPNQDNCDSIVTLELSVIGLVYDTIEVNIFKGETLEYGGTALKNEGDYPFTFTSSLGCDSLVLLKLAHFDIHVPNAFSPNEDGINDTFYPFIPASEIRSYNIFIYDRWGNQLYEGQEWDGKEAQPGVYVYVIQFEFNSGKSTTLSGDVTLVK